jgi:hypothetical protein
MANASSELATQQDGATRLNGWKDIATYLGRGIRTVQRWEKTSGLPVRRLKHGPGESVFAFTHEIDLWQMTADAASARAAAMAADEGDASRHHRNGHAAGETSAAGSDARRISRRRWWLALLVPLVLILLAVAWAAWQRQPG